MDADFDSFQNDATARRKIQPDGFFIGFDIRLTKENLLLSLTAGICLNFDLCAASDAFNAINNVSLSELLLENIDTICSIKLLETSIAAQNRMRFA